jgi:hypothetical protein
MGILIVFLISRTLTLWCVWVPLSLQTTIVQQRQDTKSASNAQTLLLNKVSLQAEMLVSWTRNRLLWGFAYLAWEIIYFKKDGKDGTHRQNVRTSSWLYLIIFDAVWKVWKLFSSMDVWPELRPIIHPGSRDTPSVLLKTPPMSIYKWTDSQTVLSWEQRFRGGLTKVKRRLKKWS